jgi:hypothetical protein
MLVPGMKLSWREQQLVATTEECLRGNEAIVLVMDLALLVPMTDLTLWEH